MNITLTIPDTHASRVIDALAADFRYDQNKQAGETKGQFVKRRLTASLKARVLRHEKKVAEAGVTVLDDFTIS